MNLKIVNTVLFITALILGIIVFYINFMIYAGIISMGLFGGLISLSLFYSLYDLLKNNKNRRMVIINGGHITLILTLFIFARPAYTYEEAQDIAMTEYLNHHTTDAIAIHNLDHKTVPADKASSWLLNKRLYYVGIGVDGQKKTTYYVIDPAKGKGIELDEPYWE